jgi:drug/metabolite transporter (DMT)-like permease
MGGWKQWRDRSEPTSPPLFRTVALRASSSSTGLFEVAGFALFAVGAHHGIAVAAVLSSLFAAIAAAAAYFLFRERLTRTQAAGVGVVVAGVAALTGVRAQSQRGHGRPLA